MVIAHRDDESDETFFFSHSLENNDCATDDQVASLKPKQRKHLLKQEYADRVAGVIKYKLQPGHKRVGRPEKLHVKRLPKFSLTALSSIEKEKAKKDENKNPAPLSAQPEMSASFAHIAECMLVMLLVCTTA